MKKTRLLEFLNNSIVSNEIAQKLAEKQFTLIEETVRKETANIKGEENLAKVFCNIVFNTLRKIVRCVESGEYDTDYNNEEELLNDLNDGYNNSFNKLCFSANFSRAGRVDFYIENDTLKPMFTYKDDLERIIYRSSFESDMYHLTKDNKCERENYKDILEEAVPHIENLLAVLKEM